MIESIQRDFTLNTPGMECYTTLKQTVEHYKQGLFVIEGDKVVQRFLDSPFTLVSVLFTDKWFDHFCEQLESRPEPITAYVGEIEQLADIVGYNYHHGVMAVGKLPPQLTLAQATAPTPKPKLFVALDKLDNAENVGVLVRNCAACGVDALIVGETSADPYLRRSVRNSMGTVFKLGIVRTDSLQQTLQQLKNDHGFMVVAAHPRITSISLYETTMLQNTCIVFGSEGDGVSQGILDVCNTVVTIPMAAGVDSFNVACASAIMLYEVNRQRAGSNSQIK